VNQFKINPILALCAVLLLSAGPASAALLYATVHYGTINGSLFSGIVKVDTTTNTITTYPKTRFFGLADSLALSADGTFIVYDTNGASIAQLHKYAFAGAGTDTLMVDFTDPAQAPASIAHTAGGSEPQDLIYDPTGTAVIVSHYTANAVTITTGLPNGPFATSILIQDSRSIYPEGLAFDNTGTNLYMLAGFGTSPCGIYKYTYNAGTTPPTATYANLKNESLVDSTTAEPHPCSLDGLTYDPVTKMLYATSAFSGYLWRIDPATLAATQVGTLPHDTSPGSANASLGPDGVVSDGRGLLYIASRGGTITQGGTSYNAAVWSFNVNTLQLNALTPVSGIDDISPNPVNPPDLTKVFNPSIISNGGTSTLTFTITNSNPAITLTGVGFNPNPDVLPTGLTATAIAPTTLPIAAGCGGSASFQVTSTAVYFSGATIAGGGTCTLPSITVTANGSATGTLQNCEVPTSNEAGPGPQGCGNITIAATANPPSLTKVFSPKTILQGSNTILQFTLTNPSASTQLTNVSFTDNTTTGWPAGLQITPASQTIPISVPCSSGTLSGGTLTVTGGNSITFSGGTLSAGATNCVFPSPGLSVTGILTGLQQNTTAVVTATDPSTGSTVTGTQASDSVTVNQPPANPPVIVKSFAQSNIAVNGTTTVTFTITNPNLTIPLSGISFTDSPLPSGIQATPATGSACGGTYTATATSITLTGGSLAAGASCTIQVTVTGITAGSYTNCVTVMYLVDGVTAPGNQSCASILIGAIYPFQIRYASNLNQGDSFVNIVNAGTAGGDPSGRICANTYVFNAAEEMVACCSCLITPDGVQSYSVVHDLIGNLLTPSVPNEVVIKLLATLPDATGKCDASAPTATNLISGMRAWGSSLHALPTFPVTYGTAETHFSIAELGDGELHNLTLYCTAIKNFIGGGYGICNNCRTGALGASQK
jgi:hypothetical protein